MFVLVTYDVSTVQGNGQQRLRRVAKTCQNYGMRVQYSVFELNVAPDQWVACKATLESIIDVEHDSLRYYFLGSNWHHRVEHVGAKSVPSPDDPLIF